MDHPSPINDRLMKIYTWVRFSFWFSNELPYRGLGCVHPRPHFLSVCLTGGSVNSRIELVNDKGDKPFSGSYVNQSHIGVPVVLQIMFILQ